MNVIEATRNLGIELQKDQRFIEYAKAKLALDKDEDLQRKIGDFNIARMNIERMYDSEDKDEEKLADANSELRSIYDGIMQNETMAAYNNAKIEVDKMMNEVLGIIRMCAEGADPLTCELPEAGCSGSCASCSGCH